jgi:hypothetical protein
LHRQDKIVGSLDLVEGSRAAGRMRSDGYLVGDRSVVEAENGWRAAAFESLDCRSKPEWLGVIAAP